MMVVVNVVGSVFLLVAVGYISVRRGLFPREGVNGLIAFINNFAVPCLLFQAMISIDLATVFRPAFLLSFYLAVFLVFILGFVLARSLFRRSPGESVVVAFSGYFTNTVLLGLPIVSRAYGDAALPNAYGIIGLHAPMLMTVGMLAMELARRDGAPLAAALREAGRRIVGNPLLIGIGLGLLVNLLSLPVPEIIDSATKTMALGVLPAALFGLGGALNQYRLRDSWHQALLSAGLKQILHPLLVLVLATLVFDLPFELVKVAVLLAAMPAGLNVYLFSTFYKRATDIAANTVLIGTASAVVTVSLWLLLLETLAPRLGG